MQPVTHGGVTVDRCTRCAGLWFDAHERERLLAEDDAEEVDVGSSVRGRALDEMRGVDCPRCGQRMLRITDARRSAVHYEQCPGCGGSFLDAGELRQLAKPSAGELLARWLAPLR